MNTQVIGFDTADTAAIDQENLLQYVNHTDLRRFGLIPELIGRLPVLTYLDPLDHAAMRRILVEPRNSLIRQYQHLFSLEGIKLNFTDDAIDFIAGKAIEYELGARGLRSICEAIMTDAMFELPGQKEIKSFTVDKTYIEAKLSNMKMEALKAA